MGREDSQSELHACRVLLYNVRHVSALAKSRQKALYFYKEHLYTRKKWKVLSYWSINFKIVWALNAENYTIR